MKKQIYQDIELSIIILSWNAFDYTYRTISSVHSFTKTPFELIVVDNGSSSETVSQLKRLEFKGLIHKLILNRKNQGFAKGNNQGFAEANGQYLLALNSDIIVSPHWDGRLINALKKLPKVGAVGPMANIDIGLQRLKEVGYDEEGIFNDISEFIEFSERHAIENSGRITLVESLGGYCLLLRRNVYEHIGGFDEAFEVGIFEDNDFCFRIQENGYSLAIVRDAVIHHFGSISFMINKINQNKLYIKNFLLLYHKWKNYKPAVNFLFQAALHIGSNLLSDGRIEAGIDLYEKALALYPENSKILYRLDSLYSNYKNLKRSLTQDQKIRLNELNRSKKIIHTARSKNCIVVPVLGMHRSGTSMITRLLNLCGLELGTNLLAASPENPKGYWENKDIIDINQDMLLIFGCHPDGWIKPEEIEILDKGFPNLKRFSFRVSELLASAFQTNFWGWKDPRSCLTFPFWENMLMSLGYLDIRPVLIVRHPISTSMSILNRGIIRSLPEALEIWKIYNILILKIVENYHCYIGHYEDYLNSKTVACEVERLMSFLSVDTHDIDKIRKWIDPDLSHYNEWDDTELDHEVSGLYKRLKHCINRQKMERRAL